jgi:PadR family transcriptional regulator PadR
MAVARPAPMDLHAPEVGLISRLTMRRLSTYRSAMTRPAKPMREPTYFVLASLLSGPLHGYAIIKRVGEMSDDRVRLGTGTLYTALDRLTAEGCVRLVSEETINGRVRRTYGLTGAGRAALRAEALRMAEAARLVTGDTSGARDARRAGWKPRTA